MPNSTTSPEFFDAKYNDDADPWHFASSPYELRRYDAIIRSLAGRTFQRTFEPGCSIGVLTERLAALSGKVYAIDTSTIAVQRAAERCRYLKSVEIYKGSLPQDIPHRQFDLIMFSEIGYYFDAQTLSDLGKELAAHLTSGGILAGVHWLGSSADHLLNGDQVHELLRGVPGLQLSHSEKHPEFRIDHWTKQ